jgi:SHS family sialic acid transporter-like MFS transporter
MRAVASHSEISRRGRVVILVTAFLGWMFAGTTMAIIPLVGRAAVRSMGVTDESIVGRWFSWYICAFLLGAACGGLLFGWIGDRFGRSKAITLSILCYSLLTGATFLVASPFQLLVLRFLACMGIGGMWPNGVALVSEAWTDVSRPFLSGLIGTSANLGFMVLSAMSIYNPITPENWRWVFVFGAAPVLLGVFAMMALPESPSWLQNREHRGPRRSSVWTVFRPPYLKLTLLGICLGAVPLMGNWGSANWMVPWAGRVGGVDDPALKAWTQWCKSGGGALGALLGGWLASRFGRRKTYFAISLLALGTSGYIFFSLDPRSPGFLAWVFAIGFFGTVYFGWLPLFLPELFPIEARATGSGVSFNWGRILTAFGVLVTGQLMVHFDGDYARVGQITCFVYVLGLIIIWFSPDTSKARIGVKPTC